jgi:hypothetical protein
MTPAKGLLLSCPFGADEVRKFLLGQGGKNGVGKSENENCRSSAGAVKRWGGQVIGIEWPFRTLNCALNFDRYKLGYIGCGKQCTDEACR